MTEVQTGVSDLAEFVRAARLPSTAERKRIRKAAGVSLREAGEAVGVTGETIWNWENDQYGPSRKNAVLYRKLLEALAQAAGTEIAEAS